MQILCALCRGVSAPKGLEINNLTRAYSLGRLRGTIGKGHGADEKHEGNTGVSGDAFIHVASR